MAKLSMTKKKPKTAKCKCCGKEMQKVPKGWADLCYDCAEKKEKQ